MERREVLQGFGAMLGLATAGPALAGGPPTDHGSLPPLGERLGAHLAEAEAQLDAITGWSSPLFDGYVAGEGLPPDILRRSLRALSALATFRDLAPEDQADLRAQAFVHGEAANMAHSTAHMANYLDQLTPARRQAVAQQLHDDPLILDQVLAGVDDVGARYHLPVDRTEQVKRHVQKAAWRLRHQPGLACDEAVDKTDRVFASTGLDRARLARLTTEPSREKERKALEYAGLIIMGVGFLTTVCGFVWGVASNGNGSTGTQLGNATIAAVVVVLGLTVLLIGFVLFLIAIATAHRKLETATP